MTRWAPRTGRRSPPRPSAARSSARPRYMRMTSSDFSLRLCAFSVLRARIWKATSASGIRIAGTQSAFSFWSDLQAMVAVRRPVDPGLGRDDHDRVHEAVDLLDHLLQALGVGGREVALVGRGRDLVDGQQAEDLPVAADRLAVDGERLAAVVLDLRRERRHGPGGTLVADARPWPMSTVAAPSRKLSRLRGGERVECDRVMNDSGVSASSASAVLRRSRRRVRAQPIPRTGAATAWGWPCAAWG